MNPVLAVTHELELSTGGNDAERRNGHGRRRRQPHLHAHRHHPRYPECARSARTARRALEGNGKPATPPATSGRRPVRRAAIRRGISWSAEPRHFVCTTTAAEIFEPSPAIFSESAVQDTRSQQS